MTQPVKGAVSAEKLLVDELSRFDRGLGDIAIVQHWLLRFRLRDELPSRRAPGAERLAPDSRPMLGRCEVCNRPLTDPGSAARGIGPECLARVEIDPRSYPRYQETRLRATRPALPRLVLALIEAD